MAAFHLDNDVPIALASLLSRHGGHTVVTARGLGMGAAGDEEHLLRAATDQRILVSHNRRDFLLLHDAWRAWSVA